MYSNGAPHMAEQKQEDQLEHTYISFVRIRDVALKTYQRRWTIGRCGERGSGISVLAARHVDDDDDACRRYCWVQSSIHIRPSLVLNLRVIEILFFIKNHMTKLKGSWRSSQFTEFFFVGTDYRFKNIRMKNVVSTFPLSWHC